MHSRTLRFALAALAAAPLSAQTTLESVSSSGTLGNQFSEAPSISADGRFIVFQSEATTLVVGDTNNVADIFLRDRTLAVTTRLSLGVGGAESNGTCSAPQISADGRFVAFLSGATNLVGGDTNVQPDVFVHELATGLTTRVSVSTSGAQANSISYAPVISADGRFIAFHSAASNLVTGDTNGAWDVFVHDRTLGTTTRAVASITGGQPNGPCAAPALSADGRLLAFHSSATNLIAGDTNAAWDVFVRDLTTGVTERVSLNSSNVAGNASSVEPSLSDDGRFVAFHSAATNLVGGDSNVAEDVFLRDRTLGLTVRASVGAGGIEGDSVSRKARLSADGRVVLFESIASNLDPGDVNTNWDVFAHDRITGTTEIVSVDSNGGGGDYASNIGALNATGRFVVFQSYATNLVSGDTNNTRDVFLRDRGTDAPVSYCTAGTTSLGCVAAISGTGTPSVSATSGFSISVANLDGQRSGLVFYGVSGSVEYPWAPGSSSFLCVKSPTQRLPLQSTGGTVGSCNGSLAVDFLAFLAANPGSLGQPFSSGDIVYAQAWFRDPPSPKSTSLSAGLVFTLLP
jgi:Tol biopolymer transport system component